MAGRLLGMVAQRIAAMLRRMARALDARPPDEAIDAATEALRARFPGAPDHWLRYIAMRAPALAGSHSVDLKAPVPPGSDPRDAAPGSRPAENAGIRRATSLKLGRNPARVERMREIAQRLPVIAKASSPDARRQKAWTRPTLRVVRSEFSNDTPARDARAGRERAPLRTSESRPLTSLPKGAAPPAERVAFPPKIAFLPGEPDPRDRLEHSGMFRWFAISRPTRSLERPSIAASQTVHEAESLAPRAWAEAPQPVPPALLLNPIAAAPRANRFERMFAATAPADAASPRWSNEESRSQWPKLPPSVDDVEAAPVSAPNLARLRAEQDQGAWSG